MLLILLLCMLNTYSMNNSIPSSGCNILDWIPDSTISYNYSFDGHNREYIVHVPINYYQNEELEPLPVIYALPGFKISPQYWSERFGMQMQGNVHNFISVITTGLPYESPQYPGEYIRAWNDLSCSGSPTINNTYTCNQTSLIKKYGFVSPQVPEECSDGGITINNTFYYNACNWCSCNNNDIQYIKELTKHIEQQYCVDITRQYVIGFSNGGMMSQRMSCEANDIFAGGAAFHGQMHIGFNCKPKYSEYAMPFMNIFGLNDTTVPGLNIIDDYGWYYLSVEDVQKKFAEFNGCDIDIEMEDIETVSDGIQGWKCKSYNLKCRNNSFTMLCEWYGIHDYPTNGSKYSQYYGKNMSSAPPGFNFGLDATWQYLSQFQRMKQNIEVDNDNKFGVYEWSFIGAGGFILILSIICCIYCWKKRKDENNKNTANLIMDQANKIKYDGTSHRKQ
eukprot:226529_1